MSDFTESMRCSECGIELDQKPSEPDRKPCPDCGSMQKTLHIGIVDTIPFTVTEWLDIKATQPSRPKKKRLRMHLQTGQQFSTKLGKYVEKERLIDKDNDRYMEKVTDPDSGDIIHLCEQPLKAHQGHGSAKFKATLPTDESGE